MLEIHLDFETYCDLDLRKVGVGRYVSHPSFRVLLAAWALPEGPVRQWTPAEGEPLPGDLEDLLSSPEVIIWAHNAAFERAVLWAAPQTRHIRLPLERFRDTMVLANTCALPPDLARLSKVLGLDKDGSGKQAGAHLIRKFCVPTRRLGEKFVNTPENEPEAWEEFKTYNRMDVEAERAVHRKLLRYAPEEWVWDMWILDQRINERGLPVNVPMVCRAVRMAEAEKARLLAELAELVGIDNANSQAQLLPALRRLGYPFDDLQKAHVARVLAQLEEGALDVPQPEKLKKALLLRQEASVASVAKFAALERATECRDGERFGRLRGAFQFLGAARTGRWAGRVFQPQNLPRPHWSLEKRLEPLARAIEFWPAPAVRRRFGPLMECLRSAVRPAVQAPPGYRLVDADLSAIENRLIGWICGDEKILDVFRQGRDPYVDFATYMFRQPYAELWAEYKAGDKSKRTLAKPAVLGAGYRLGKGELRIDPETGQQEATGLLGYAMSLGVDMTPEEAEHAVTVFRKTYADVTAFWTEFEDKVKWVIRTGHRTRSYWFDIERDRNFLRIRLPSGRWLHYYAPSIRPRETPWGEVRPTISYIGMNMGQWVRQFTHGGKLLENVTQAVAADVLMTCLRRAEERGFNVIMHVHDQIVALEPASLARERLEELIALMSEPIDWAPGLPLGAAGAVTRVFVKD